MAIATIGETEHLVTFEAPGPPVPDGRGGFTYAWTPLTPARWYVRIQPSAGAGGVAASGERLQAPGAIVTHTAILVHGAFHPGVTEQTRMRDAAGRVYHIKSVLNLDARGVEMQLQADLEA